MYRTTLMALAVALGACLASTARAAPPRVVRAVPDNAEIDVDPGLTEIRITFDQDMNTRSGYSIVGGGPTFPELKGKPTWADPRTLVLRVKLKPDWDYALSVNNAGFTNTRSARGEPCTPYPIAFSTACEAKADDAIKAANRKAIAALRKAIDEDYSYRDLRKVNWKMLIDDSAGKLETAPHARAFARLAARIMDHARDVHVSVRAGDQRYGHFRRTYEANFNYQTLPRVLPEFTRHNDLVATGATQSGQVYVLIAGWNSARTDLLKPAYDAIAAADPKKGLILDVRPNGGGDELMARAVAGCFVDSTTPYARNQYRDRGIFGQTFTRSVEPNSDGPVYRGKVAVLMGPGCLSSNESFLHMMRAAGATLVGARSGGSSGNPKPHDLGNGVTVVLPSWRDLELDGTCMEGVGVNPDVEVRTSPADFEKGDPVLDAACR